MATDEQMQNKVSVLVRYTVCTQVGVVYYYHYARGYATCVILYVLLWECHECAEEPWVCNFQNKETLYCAKQKIRVPSLQ